MLGGHQSKLWEELRDDPALAELRDQLVHPGSVVDVEFKARARFCKTYDHVVLETCDYPGIPG